MPMGNISLDNMLGAFSLGATLENILFGITCLQSALYYKNYPNDTWFYKASVGIIWLLDTFDVAVTTHTVYFYAIKNSGNIQVLTQHEIVWSFKLHILIYVLIRIFLQGMYALHVWKFGQKLHQGILWLILATLLVGYHITGEIEGQDFSALDLCPQFWHIPLH
ncbi:hypothetical protein F5146DRAFT_1132249 [Armillaria mellea]|nr:hypothetical protein F5146DRAFT_1132249 [Armillaria mellea]